ncbi:hypothetical protein ACHAXN_002984 [Cyclotella atomus]
MQRVLGTAALMFGSSIMALQIRHLHLSANLSRHCATRAAYLGAANIGSPHTSIANHRVPTSLSSRSVTPSRASTHQKRSYTVNLARDDNGGSSTNDKILQPSTPQEMARNNVISTRLYRILLKSCIRGVKSANSGNAIDTANDSSSSGSWILLQPPLDVRKYGHANVLQVRTGELHSISTDGDDSTVDLSYNPALKHMNKTQVGRAMDVLRFVHMSLGGKDDDDLEDYYLKLSTLDKTVAAEFDGSGDANNDHGKGDLDKNLGAAAGRHAEGHYTQFLDEDEERGEGQPTTDSKDISDEELEEYQSQHEELEDDYHNPQDPSILAHCSDIANAIRIAFRAPIAPAPESSSDDTTMQSIITRRHRDAIDASSLLAEQIYAWDRKSSISVNNQHGVRIVATSSCLQLSNMGGSVRVGGKKYKFAYRIRVENTNNDNNKVVQLLGRTWNIYECRHTNASLLTKLLEEGSLPSGDEEEGEEDISIRTLVQNVHEPKTGAVGHFPVIRPGEVFEYISGAEIGTPTGFMEGAFHMAIVDPEKTESGSIGESVDALLWKENDERKFEAKVAEFGFVANEDET